MNNLLFSSSVASPTTNYSPQPITGVAVGLGVGVPFASGTIFGGVLVVSYLKKMCCFKKRKLEKG